MKRAVFIVASIALAASLTACEGLDELMRFNFLEGLAAVNLSDEQIAKMDVGELSDYAESDSFYEDLEEKPENKDAALDVVDAALDANAAGSAGYEEAAILGANIELYTTPAGELVTNISSLINGVINGTTDLDDPNADISGIIQSILPASMVTLNADGSVAELDEALFVAMINGFEAANAYYTLLGNSLGDDFASGITDAEIGDLAQAALITAVVAAIEVPVGYTTGDYLYNVIMGTSGYDSASITYDADTTFADGSYVFNILGAAGLDDMITSLSGS